MRATRKVRAWQRQRKTAKRIRGLGFAVAATTRAAKQNAAAVCNAIVACDAFSAALRGAQQVAAAFGPPRDPSLN